MLIFVSMPSQIPTLAQAVRGWRSGFQLIGTKRQIRNISASNKVVVPLSQRGVAEIINLVTNKDLKHTHIKRPKIVSMA